MSATTGTTSTTYAHVLHQRTVDGGHSGELTITAAAGNEGAATLVFVDSELLGNLVLSPEQAVELGESLLISASEGIPPYSWDLGAFKSTFGYEPPAEHTRTLADLKRHVRALSDAHESEEARA